MKNIRFLSKNAIYFRGLVMSADSGDEFVITWFSPGAMCLRLSTASNTFFEANIHGCFEDLQWLAGQATKFGITVYPFYDGINVSALKTLAFIDKDTLQVGEYKLKNLRRTDYFVVKKRSEVSVRISHCDGKESPHWSTVVHFQSSSSADDFIAKARAIGIVMG